MAEAGDGSGHTPLTPEWTPALRASHYPWQGDRPAAGPSVYLCFDTVKIAKLLTGIHERAGLPGLKELFSSPNGYLVHHLPKDIFDVTIAFLVSENVDFGILYAIL